MLFNSKELCVISWRLSLDSKEKRTKAFHVLEIMLRRKDQLAIGKEWLVE